MFRSRGAFDGEALLAQFVVQGKLADLVFEPAVCAALAAAEVEYAESDACSTQRFAATLNSLHVWLECHRRHLEGAAVAYLRPWFELRRRGVFCTRQQDASEAHCTVYSYVKRHADQASVLVFPAQPVSDSASLRWDSNCYERISADRATTACSTVETAEICIQF